VANDMDMLAFVRRRRLDPRQARRIIHASATIS
jgi:hypothetical protein